MKFLFDEMLKRLSNWSRIFGISSEYFTGRTDTQLLEHAEKNDLIFVTKDSDLSKRCKKKEMKCIFIESDKLEEQLAQLIKESGVEITFPEKMRCAACNGELKKVEKESVKDKVPEDVYEKQQELWQCSSCGKVYWQGGHWKNIKRIHQQLMLLLGK